MLDLHLGRGLVQVAAWSVVVAPGVPSGALPESRRDPLRQGEPLPEDAELGHLRAR